MKRRGGPPDLRLLPSVGAGWAGTWLGLTLPAGPAFATAAAIALGALSGMVRAHRRAAAHPLAAEPAAATVCAALLVAAGLALSAAVHAAVVMSGPVPGLAAHSALVTATFTVTADPRRIEPPAGSRRPALALLPIRITALTAPTGERYRLGSAATLLARLRGPAQSAAWLSLLPSQRAVAQGRLEPPRPGTRDAALFLADRAPRLLGGPSAVQRFAGGLRADLRDAVSALPAEPRGLLPALAVGDTSMLQPDSAAAFKRTGLTYLTVASGENLVFASAGLLPLVRWAGLRGRAVSGAAVLLILGFTLLARPGPPMVRATVMSLLGCAAVVSGRRARALATMAAAVLALLLIDPWLARTYGFALSVLASAGLLIAAPGWRDGLLERGIPGWIAAPAAATAAAEVFCEPLLVVFTGVLPLIAVPANVLAVPAAPIATVLGICAMGADALWPAAGHAVAWLGQWPVRWICLVARAGSAVPGAAVGWPRGVGGCGLLLLGYGAVQVAAARAARWRKRSDPGSNRFGRSFVTSTGLDKRGV